MTIEQSQEILISWSDTLLEGDFLYAAGDLSSDQGITSAVMISLFTDAQAAPDDILPDPNFTDRRGWWGDLVAPEVEGDRIGSLLWLLERSKTTPSVLISAKRYCEQALQWMVDDGVASSVVASVERQGTTGNDRLAISVSITMIDSHVVTIRFKDILFGG
jgi:phage gp46-like protein